MTATRIDSRAGRYYATLADDHADGITVSIWRYSQKGFSKRVDRWVLPCPFHVACDTVYELVWPLADDAATIRRERN